MKKILLILFIIPLFFIKNVNAAYLYSTCKNGSNPELDTYVLNHLDYLSLRYNKIYKYVTYCLKKDYDETKEETQTIAHGCLFNYEKDFSEANLIYCELYFTIQKTNDNIFRTNYASDWQGFTFHPTSFEMTYFELNSAQENLKNNLKENADISKTALMILTIFFFVIVIALIVGW